MIVVPRMGAAAVLVLLLAGCAGRRGSGGSTAPGEEPRPAALAERDGPDSPSAAARPERRERRKPIARTKPRDVRSSWVVRSSVSSDAAAARIAEEASAAGLNTLMVQVRGRGDAWYQSALEPRPATFADPGFDPLDAMLEHALAHGLWVHAWVNAALVGGPHKDPRHVANAHPEWLMVPAELAPSLLRMPPGEPQFRSALDAWVAGHEKDVEGLYADPADPGYRAHLVAVCRDLVSRYPVDGIHLDYIRYPGPDWGFSRGALEAFRDSVDAELGPTDRSEMERRRKTDPMAYPRRFATRWTAFRREAVDRTVRDVAEAARDARPGLRISAAVFPDIPVAQKSVLQDWPRWLAQGWIDVACPMIYTKDRKTFEAQLRAAQKARGRGEVWAGIGAWQIEDAETLERIRFARASGAQGVVLFSHGHLEKRPGLFGRLRGTFSGD